jgi:hypothetical protein
MSNKKMIFKKVIFVNRLRHYTLHHGGGSEKERDKDFAS